VTRPQVPQTQPREEVRTLSGQRIVELPPTDNRTAFRLGPHGKTFVGPRGRRTEVYVHITPNGRVEIKIRRDNEFLADYYVAAES